MENKEIKPCFACKIVSICCLCGIGSYLIYTARIQPQRAKHVLFTLGIGSVMLGIGEIFDKSPFRNYKEST